MACEDFVTSLGPVFVVSVPETTLSPSYPRRVNFSPVFFKSSTNRLHEDHQLVSERGDNSGGGGGELSHLGR